MFGVLDLDAAPYLERGRILLEKFRGVNFPEDQVEPADAVLNLKSVPTST